MPEYLAKESLICFTQEELRQIFESSPREQLLNLVVESGLSTEELNANPAKMQEIADQVSIINDKEDIEIFSALYVFPRFYGESTKVCFLLKTTVDPRKTPVNDLKTLKQSLKEADLTDFVLCSDDGFRFFQLKQYKADANASDFTNFITEKLKHYGYDLGSVNLLIVLQSGGILPENFFEDVHNAVSQLSVKGDGEVLVFYNENNKTSVINTVYPTLDTTRIPHKKFSE